MGGRIVVRVEDGVALQVSEEDLIFFRGLFSDPGGNVLEPGVDLELGLPSATPAAPSVSIEEEDGVVRVSEGSREGEGVVDVEVVVASADLLYAGVARVDVVEL